MTEARVRHAARVLLLDESGRVLLLNGWDPSLADRVGWWFTPGGGLEGDETHADAALRELAEETGLRLASLGDSIYERSTQFEFDGERIRQIEVYFTATVPAFEVDRSGWTELEQSSVGEVRWWSVEELEATSAVFYPENLVELLRARTEVAGS